VKRRNTTDGSVIYSGWPALRRVLRRLVAVVSCVAVLIGTSPARLEAQTAPAPQPAAAEGYNVEQLDALLAPIALYPDQLLTQILMACTYPLQVVEAARWVEDPANKTLTGDALTAALVQQPWDPSVKSLVPFPQVLLMMNSKLDWMQQVGYAMSVQQSAVMDSVQRLRRQAQAAGQLQTTPQQVVTTQDQVIVIAPAQPNVVYVPTYNPTVVYGAWPYPSYPPVYLPPPPGYYVGSAIMAGLVFGASVAVVGGLWGWATPNWRYGNVNVNVNRYNNINVNRPPINNPGWRPPPGQPGRPGGGYRPPATGPVGRPERPVGLPANGIGRPNVSVPGGVVRPPSGMGPGNRPPIGQGGTARPGGAPSAPGQGTRPGVGQGNPGQGNRPGGGAAARPVPGTRPGGGGPSALGGMNDGRNAAQFQNRGAQSREQAARPSGGGARPQGGAARPQGGAARPQGGAARPQGGSPGNRRG
jgi:hypothetical protein